MAVGPVALSVGTAAASSKLGDFLHAVRVLIFKK
jgi:hypothetical protein